MLFGAINSVVCAAPYVDAVVVAVVTIVVIVPTHRTKAVHEVYGLYYIILGYTHVCCVCAFIAHVCVCCIIFVLQRNLHYNNLATVIVWMHSTHTHSHSHSLHSVDCGVPSLSETMMDIITSQTIISACIPHVERHNYG